MSAVRALVATATASVVLVLVAACGLPTMDRAQTLPSDLVPEVSSSSASPTSTSPPALVTPSLYFVVGDDSLRGVRRATKPLQSTAQQAAELLGALSDGPTATERDAGLSNAVPPGLSLGLAQLSGGRAVVDVVGTDPGPAAAQAHLVAGQIVLTLTGLPGIDTVSLTRNGRPLDASLPDGSLTALPLTRADYADLLAG